MFSKVDYIMVNVSDMSRSVAFYRDILGLPLKFESPGWSEFQTGATTLALHLIRTREGREGGAPAGPGGRRRPPRHQEGSPPAHVLHPQLLDAGGFGAG